MGLDKYREDSSDDSDDDSKISDEDGKQSNTNAKEPTTSLGEHKLEDTELTYYGDTETNARDEEFEPEGIMEDVRMVDLAQALTGVIEIEVDALKYHLPTYYEIERDEEYETSSRYQLEYVGNGHPPTWSGRVVTCVGRYRATVGTLNKEVVMLESGKHMKDDAMKYLKDRLGDDIEKDTEVFVYFFADTLHTRNIVQRSNETKSGTLINRDDVMYNILRHNRKQ